jgi:DNA-binding transcriptional MerR regulator
MGEHRNPFPLKIGELARRLGLNTRTLRYYESIGLLPPSSRTESGYRLYSEADERRLRFVLQAKQVGFSLEEIQRILELGRHGSACGYVQQTVTRHIADIDGQITELQHLRSTLAEIAAAGTVEGTKDDNKVCGLIERRAPAPVSEPEEDDVTIQGRSVEVFTAGCPVCDPVVQLVQRVACPTCVVTILNVKDDPQAADRAKAANVQRLPLVLVDGKLLECCATGPVTEAALRAAGVGRA